MTLLHYHNRSSYTVEKLSSDKRFIDWKSQPSSFKVYPDFYPKIDFEDLDKNEEYFKLIGGVNSKVTIGETLYHLRVIPSAGGLYPTELYIQIKGIKNLVDGIYHYEAINSKLTLLYEIIGLEGVEPYLNIDGDIEGFIFLISSNYFRSSWKYSDRAFRYCLLEAGHQMGAIEMANYINGKSTEFIFEFDKEKLNYMFGFEDKEFFISAIVSGKDRKELSDPLDFKLPFVIGTDYYMENQIIVNAYWETLTSETNICNIASEFKRPKFPYNREALRYAIWLRRSKRFFNLQVISKRNYEYIYRNATIGIPSHTTEICNIYSIVLSVKRLKSGIYKNLKLKREGNFSEDVKRIFLGQNLVKDANVIFVITGKWHNYQTIMAQAGVISHRICICATYINIGSTPVSSYLDDEMREFLDSSNEILTAIAVGK